MSIIIRFFKTGEIDQMDKYRPITIILLFSKINKKTLYIFLDGNKLERHGVGGDTLNLFK